MINVLFWKSTCYYFRKLCIWRDSPKLVLEVTYLQSNHSGLLGSRPGTEISPTFSRYTTIFRLDPFLLSVYTQNITHHFVSLTLGPRMNWLALAVLAWALSNFLIGWQFRTNQSQASYYGTLEKAGLPHTAGLDCSLQRLGRGRPKIHLDFDAGKRIVGTKNGGKIVYSLQCRC